MWLSFSVLKIAPLCLPLTSTHLTGLLCGQNERGASCYARSGSVAVTPSRAITGFSQTSISPPIMLRTPFIGSLASPNSVSQTKSSNIIWEPVSKAETRAPPPDFLNQNFHFH